MKKKIIIPLIALLLGVSSFVKDDGDDFELIKNLEIFHTLMRDIRILYVDETSSGELIKTAMDEMLKHLDPYTVYYPESLVEDVMFINTGEYAGIGADLEKYNGVYQVVEISEASPADKAGILIGDKIIRINGNEIKDKSIDEISLLIKGEPGTSLNLTYLRDNVEQNVSVKRAMIKEKNIPYFGKIADKTGYINLSGFTENCSKELKTAFLKLKNDEKIDKLVIDLRYNPGGLLIEAVNIVNLFVDKGESIVEMKGRVEQWNKVFRAENNPVDTKIPIVVLVNGRSASASEIVSGALQDLDRAVILGEKTFGKGLVQTTKDLTYNSKLKITTAKYYIPSGRCIQKLDYSHKDSQGNATQISESQFKTFKTKNGRPVKDAGGIMPDINADVDSIAEITANLIAENIIFDYATLFRLKHDKISSPEEFEVTDADMEDFKKFAGSKLFEYQTSSDGLIKELNNLLKAEYGSSEISLEVQKIQEEIKKQKQKKFSEFYSQIKTALATEIISRYYYQEGVIRYTLKHDSFLEKAKSVLNDQNLYKKVLSGQVK
ncbi:MAG: S41 family peptidase [Bacteroidales bacterium]|nr:S41 family peptidase [Bacteroidales bacterium]